MPTTCANCGCIIDEGETCFKMGNEYFCTDCCEQTEAPEPDYEGNRIDHDFKMEGDR